MLSTLLGISTLVRPVQSQNASSPMLITLFGIFTLSRRYPNGKFHARIVTAVDLDDFFGLASQDAGQHERAAFLDTSQKGRSQKLQRVRQNVGDHDVLKCIRMLTFLPLEEIDKMDAWEGSQLNEAKEILAYELTSLVHGKEEAEKAKGGRIDGQFSAFEELPDDEGGEIPF